MADILGNMDAVGVAEAVRSGALSPVEAVDAAIARIERLDPELNSVIIRRFDQARAAAAGDLPDGPLRGVPFLLKDIGANLAGWPYHGGCAALKGAGTTAASDTVLGARFVNAGLVPLGKTNLPELGTCPTTQPLAYGPTHNPWDLTRSPAGSSGGSAAAVAAGLVPIAHANDGGGSTRLPAAWCGLVGLKTSRGRIPAPDTTSRLRSELAVSRTVRDTAAMLDAVHGPVEGDLYRVEPPERPFADEVGRSPEPARIALLVDGGVYDIDPDCVAAAQAVAEHFDASSAGHSVDRVDGEVLFGGDGRINGQLWMAGIASRLEDVARLVGRELADDDIEPYNRAAAERGRSMLATELAHATEVQQQWSADVCDWFADYDMLITPTAGCPPMRTDDLWPDEDAPWRIGRTYGRIGVFTLPFNATGHPAISVPVHQTADGLPVGVQLVGRIGGEGTLLRFAAELEQAMPWADRRPVIWAGD